MLTGAHWDHHSIIHLHGILRIRSSPAHSFRGALSRRQVSGVVIRVEFLVHLSQGHLAKQQDASAAFLGSETVVGRLRRHVCKVDSLSKHVAGHWGLRRGDAQALTEDSHKVSQSTSVPQQHLVFNVLSVPDIFGFALEGEEVDQLELVGVVGRSVGGLQVFVDELKLCRIFAERVNLAIELFVVGIELVLTILSCIDQRGGYLNLGERLQHLDLLLDQTFCIEDEIAHPTEAKVVRDGGVEFTGKGLNV